MSNVQWRSLQETSVLAVIYCSKVVCSLRATLHPVPSTAPRWRRLRGCPGHPAPEQSQPCGVGTPWPQGLPYGCRLLFSPIAQEGRPILLLSAPWAGSSPANTVGPHAQEGVPCLQQPPTRARAQPAWGRGRSQLPGPCARVPLSHPAGHPSAGGCAGTQPPASPSCGLFKAVERLLGAGGFRGLSSVQEACEGPARDGFGGNRGKKPQTQWMGALPA